MITLTEFLNGKPLRYKSLSGAEVCATWRDARRDGLHYPEIRRAEDDKLLMRPIYSRVEAEQFYSTVEQKHAQNQP